jgi:hypothetical protein
MKRTLLVIALMASAAAPAAADAQTGTKYFARQWLAGVKEAAAKANQPTDPVKDPEPDKPAEPVGPCESGSGAHNMVSGGSVTVGRYVATRIPAQMCAGGDVKAPTGTRHLHLQPDNNLVIYFNPGQSDAKWASSTQYSSANTLATQPNGNVQLLRNDGSVVWSTNTGGNPGAFAAMAQTGSMIVVSANGRNVIWSTNTDVFDPADVEDGTAASSDQTRSTIAPMVMERNESVVSPNGKCRFSVQNDSNLVLYYLGSPIWASGTQYSDGYRLVTGSDGDVRFVRANGSLVFSTGTAGNPGARLRMQDDCDAAVFSADGKNILWHTNTSRKTQIVDGG